MTRRTMAKTAAEACSPGNRQSGQHPDLANLQGKPHAAVNGEIVSIGRTFGCSLSARAASHSRIDHKGVFMTASALAIDKFWTHYEADLQDLPG